MTKEYIRFATGKTSTWCTFERNESMGPHFVYILLCQDDKLYCGQTKNIIRRIVDHLNKRRKGNRFTKQYPPVKLIHLERLPSYLHAINRESSIWKEIKSGVRKVDDPEHSVMQEYIGIFVIISEMLKTNSEKNVLKKLSNITQKGG